jgi:hypothetical protein
VGFPLIDIIIQFRAKPSSTAHQPFKDMILNVILNVLGILNEGGREKLQLSKLHNLFTRITNISSQISNKSRSNVLNSRLLDHFLQLKMHHEICLMCIEAAFESWKENIQNES